MRVQIDYADGRYIASEYTGPEPAVEMSEAHWAAYLNHRVQCQFWHAFLQKLDDEQRELY